jgi:YidC/Oxa1 family membrane protein insertase
MLLQLPVFIALYYTLRHFKFTGDLTFLHFIPSIKDGTTAHWGGYVLLVVYVVSQMASSYFMMTTTDKTQRILFMVMPVVFVFIIARFPAGLVLYWVTTNLWTVGQGLVTRRLVPKPATATATDAPAGPKRSSRTPPKADTAGNGAAAEKARPATAAPPQTRRVKKKKGGARR